MDYNSLTLTVRLGADPETRYTTDGKIIVSFRAANNRYRKNGQDQEARWYHITAFGRTAETLDKLASDGYLRKGSQVLVEGEHDYEEWEDKNGKTRTTQKMNLNKFTLMGGKNEGAGERVSAPSAPPAPSGRVPHPSDTPDWLFEGDHWLHRETGEVVPIN